MNKAVLSLISIFACLPLLARQEITPPTFGTTAYPLTNPVVATNGETFLTLWTVDTNLGGSHIYGSLADAKGRPLSPLSSLIIPNASISQLFASGSGYVAIIVDRSSGGTTRTARLSSDGRLVSLGPALAPIRVTFYGSEPYLARAFNGSEFFTVAYHDESSPPEETVAQVSRSDGSIIRQMTMGKFFHFVVASSGSDFVVAAAESDGLFLRRFGRNGSEVSPKVRISAADSRVVYFLAVASSGNETAVAWTQQTGSGYTTHFAVVSNDGIVSAESQVETASVTLQLRSNTSSYVLLTSQPAVIRFDRAGRLVEGPVAIASAATSIAATDSFAYAAGLTGYPLRSVFGTAVTIEGSLRASSPAILSTMPRRQVWPVIASDGAGFLAIWSDQTAESKNLAATRLDQNGAPRDASQIDLGPASAPSDDVYGGYSNGPAYSVVSGRENYLVVWQRGFDVVAMRIDRSGNLLDQQPMVIRTKASISDRAVVWNGSAFFLTWIEQGGLRGVTISESGTVSQPLALPTGSGSGVPSVSWDGTRLLLTAILYQGPICTCTPTPYGISLIRLSSDGLSLDKAPTVLSIPAARYRVATSGREFVMVSDEYDYREAQFRIVARRMRADGASLQVSAPVRVFQWTQPTISEVDWNGHDFVVAWRYTLGLKKWLGLMHLTEELDPFGPLYTESALDIYDRPSLATNAAGGEIIAMSEISSPGSAARIRTLSESEMRVQPVPPPTALVTSAVGTSQSAIVSWQVSPTAVLEGFIIEASNPYANFATPIAVLPADVRSATVSIASRTSYVTPQFTYVRMRTFNAGGVSEPTASVHVTLPLRNHR